MSILPPELAIANKVATLSYRVSFLTLMIVQIMKFKMRRS